MALGLALDLFLEGQLGEVIVTMQAQKEAPFDMQCKDKFLIEGVIASPEVTAKEVTREMFNKEAGHTVEETKLRVTYLCYDTNTITCSSGIRRRFSFTSNTLSDVSCNGIGAACHKARKSN
ncbi:unnamed protein product [Arabis nemorensis]|uniref:MSP domain-containing protein n=1 Tax=Arabis nemorensis TaxID=586526 RepID=A0A565CT15_9BRAS|nr:unnamed protein product [Arabis nemorensis]